MKILYLLTIILILSFGNCFTTTDYESKVKYKNFEAEKIKINNISELRLGFQDGEDAKKRNIHNFDTRIPIVIDPETKLGLQYFSVNECPDSNISYLVSLYTLSIIPFFTECKRHFTLEIYYHDTLIRGVKRNETYSEKNVSSFIAYLLTFPIQILWRLIGDPYSYKTEAQVRNDLLVLAYPELVKFSKMSDSELEAYLGLANESKNSGTDLPTTFNDIVVLRNGEILEGVHTKVTPTTLEVTESNGKKTVYKKSQVLSVKKK